MRVVTGHPDEVFVGRERECRTVEKLLGTVVDGGGSLVVCGEAGVGKTALLRREAAAAGAPVTAVRGVESEAVLPFATVGDVVAPLTRHLDRLPAVQREALEISLARRPGTVSSPLATCSAVLGLLVAAGEQEPQVIVVDDLQWVDPPSRQVLLFVARRLATARVAILFGLRADADDPVPADLPVLRLDGLGETDARTLAGRLGVTVADDVLVRLVGATGGNPLAITETLASATAPALRGDDGFEGPHIGPVLRRAWTTTLDDLPEDSVRALAVLAAGHAGTSSELVPVLEALGLGIADLAPSERDGLVRTRRGRLELRHPLLRTVVLERLTSADRLRVYRALADSADGHRRAWYRAAAATAPDDTVADELAAAAVEATARGAHGSAARTWARAAEFRSGDARQAELLYRAATEAELAGDSHAVQRWCDQVLARRADPALVADVELVRARSTTWLGHPVRAIADLVAAAECIGDDDPARAARLYADATLPCAMSGRITEMLRIAARAEECAGDAPPVPTAAAVAAAYGVGGLAADARRLLAVADHGLERSGTEPELPTLTNLAQAHLFVEDHDRSAELLTRARREARRLGAPAALVVMLSASTALGWWTGDWVGAYADGAEALQWAEELGQAGGIGYALVGLGRLDAARGDEVGCRARMDRATREIHPYGLDCLDVYVPAVLGLLALGGGHNPQALDHLERAAARADDTGMANPVTVPLWGDLLDARLRAGDRDGAGEVADRMRQASRVTGMVHPAVVAARGDGMLAGDPESAREGFARAHAAGRRRPMPFENARTLLYEGETLRRLRRPALARAPLHEALAGFDRLGARPWSARAEQELHATGAARPRTSEDPAASGGSSAFEALTPQEFQTARAVATGLNNTEVAGALFVSRKTVEAHLSRVYRKLGLRSRAELVRAFGAAGVPVPASRR